MGDNSSGDSGSGGSSSDNSGSDVKSRMREDGKTDTFFGGDGKADGSGHGHAVANDRGGIEYLRDTDGTVIKDDRR